VEGSCFEDTLRAEQDLGVVFGLDAADRLVPLPHTNRRLVQYLDETSHSRSTETASVDSGGALETEL
jgi:hypothetical protein